MLLVYIVSAIVAGVLVLLSLFGAEHDSDVHMDIATDHGSFLDHDQGFWLPFFSLRFYTYFFAAFGTTGLLLHYLTDIGTVNGAWIAGAVGLVAGLSIALMVRLLRVTETTTSSKEKDVLGKEGTVLVAIRGSNPGRIRCMVKGELIDFLAITEEAGSIEPGEMVVVVAMEGGRAQVVSRSSIFNEDELPQRTTL